MALELSHIDGFVPSQYKPTKLIIEDVVTNGYGYRRNNVSYSHEASDSSLKKHLAYMDTQLSISNKADAMLVSVQAEISKRPRLARTLNLYFGIKPLDTASESVQLISRKQEYIIELYRQFEKFVAVHDSLKGCDFFDDPPKINQL